MQSSTLRFVYPSGSLRNRFRAFMTTMGYVLGEPDQRGYCGTSNHIEFYERDRRMVPLQVAGMYDAGLTGKDLIAESGVEGLRTVGDFCFSRSTTRPTRWVLAGDFLFEEESVTWDVIRVGCELPRLGETLFSRSPYGNRKFRMVKLEGNEEAAISDGLCDTVLCVTETGGALNRANLRILGGCDELFVSVPQIIAKPTLSLTQEDLLKELTLSLSAAIAAEQNVMLTFDLQAEKLRELELPSAVAPTVSPLTQDGWISVQICTERSKAPSILRTIEGAGGKGVVLQNLDAFLR